MRPCRCAAPVPARSRPPSPGLAWIAKLEQGGEPAGCPCLHAANAEFLSRLGARAAAIAAYTPCELAANAVELQYLQSRRDALALV